MKKHIWKKAAAAVLAFGMAVSMTACSGGSSSTAAASTVDSTSATAEASTGEKYRIGLSMGTSNTEFCMKLMKEVQNACDENPDVELITLSADSDANTQVMNIDNLVTMGVDAICVYPVDPQVCADSMKKARDAGIYVVIIDQIKASQYSPPVESLSVFLADYLTSLTNIVLSNEARKLR